jgi:glutamate/aspartate transport system substrate-binding protein
MSFLGAERIGEEPKCACPRGPQEGKQMRAMAITFTLVSLVNGAVAEEPVRAFRPELPGEMTGTLKRIDDTGLIRLGYPKTSVPFAFVVGNEPVGYSIDLCSAIVKQITDELAGTRLHIEYRTVDPESRFSLLVADEIDLECGTTTSNPERREQVAFSPIIFVTGTKLLAKCNESITALRDLRGKTLVVTEGTTNSTVIAKLNELHRLGITLLTRHDPQQSFAALIAGKADAFASDEVLLKGWIANNQAVGEYCVVGDFLSYEPYGLVFRKDDFQFAELVERTFRRLARSGELYLLYEKWFTHPLPSGIPLDLPMNTQLRDIFRMLELSVEPG